MSWRSVATLWCVAIVLVGGVLAWQRIQPAGGAGREIVARPVFAPAAAVDEAASGLAWPDDEPDRLVLERAGDPRRVFERDGDRWTQTEPVVHPLDPFSMQQMITLARELRAIDVIDPDTLADPRSEGDADRDALTLGMLGLDPPEARLTIGWSDGTDRTIDLGRRGIGGRAYAMVPAPGTADDGSARSAADPPTVMVVPQALHDRAVAMNPHEWRDRAIFGDVSADVVSSVTISAGDLVVRLERDRRTWRVTSPLETRLSTIALDELLQQIASARLAGFVLDRPDRLDPFGLDPGLAVLDVALQRPGASEPEHIRLRLGARAGAGTQDRFGLVEGRDTVIRVPAALIGVVTRDPARWADPTASGTRPADIAGVTITDPAGAATIARRDRDRWAITGPDETTTMTDGGAPDALLDLLTNVQAIGLTMNTLPAEWLVATVVLEGFDGLPIDVVRLGRRPSGEWITDNGDGVLRLFPAGVALPLDAAALLEG